MANWMQVKTFSTNRNVPIQFNDKVTYYKVFAYHGIIYISTNILKNNGKDHTDFETNFKNKASTNTSPTIDTMSVNGDIEEIIETVNSNKKFIGKIKKTNGTLDDTDKAIFQISRIIIQQTVEKMENAGNGDFDQVWDNRESLFSAEALFNEKSILFDGIDEHIDCGTNSDIQFVKENQFSVSFWLKTPGNNTDHIIGNWIPFNGWRVRMDATGKLAFQFSGTSGHRVQTTDTAYDDDVWRHFIVTYKSNTITWYVNGSSVASTNSSDALGAGEGLETSAFTIAAHSGSDQYLAGYLDEMSIFSVELNSVDVLRIYNSGVPTDLTSENNIIHWWRMGDGDTYPTIFDKIQTMNGTMVNMEAGDIVSVTP